MGLPIPDILEKAAKVIDAAKRLCASPTSVHQNELQDACKNIDPKDILAVLNEVGRVYQGMHNQQVVSIGSRPNPAVLGNPQNKGVDVAITVEFGLGHRTLITSFPADNIKQIIANLQESLDGVQPKGVITQVH